MPLQGQKKIEPGQDRGRVLPLGVNTFKQDGFERSQQHAKTVDTPNAYIKFSKRTAKPSENNHSALTPRHGAMSALGDVEYRGGKKPMVTPRGGSHSYQNDAEPEKKTGIRQTGVEKSMVAARTYLEDHPRKLTKAVGAPVRPALNEQGESPFITGNGMIGKFGVSPNKAQKNRPTTVEDLDTKSQSRRRAMDENKSQPARYNSEYRQKAQRFDSSPIKPETLPLHPEIDKTGPAKVQRFAVSRRASEQSLHGVFSAAVQKAPPPYKLVAPFHTSD